MNAAKKTVHVLYAKRLFNAMLSLRFLPLVACAGGIQCPVGGQTRIEDFFGIVDAVLHKLTHQQCIGDVGGVEIFC